MSQISQGPDWWMASDGLWYPPETHPSVVAQTEGQATAPNPPSSGPSGWGQPPGSPYGQGAWNQPNDPAPEPPQWNPSALAPPGWGQPPGDAGLVVGGGAEGSANRRRPPGWAIVAVAAVVGLLVGGGTWLVIRTARSSTIASGSSTTSSTPTSPAESLLEGVDFGSSDVPNGYFGATVQDGTSLSGENGVTLNLCNASFPSEKLRVTRLQTAIWDGTGHQVASTEGVLYQAPTDTALAFSELRSARANCPSTFVKSPGGQPAIQTAFGPSPDTGWPTTTGVERLAFDLTMTFAPTSTTSTVPGSNVQSSTVVYLRRGKLLVGVYFYEPDPQPDVAGQTTIEGVVGVIEQRMAQLPSSAVR